MTTRMIQAVQAQAVQQGLQLLRPLLQQLKRQRRRSQSTLNHRPQSQNFLKQFHQHYRQQLRQQSLKPLLSMILSQKKSITMKQEITKALATMAKMAMALTKLVSFLKT